MGNHLSRTTVVRGSPEQTVKDAIASAVATLTAAAIELPRMTAELLLARTMNRTRVWLLAHSEETLPAPDSRHFQTLVRRRASGEPLQYIVGEQEFYGRAFRVTPDVLIPRPETELVVEKALELASLLPGILRPGEVSIVDVGTGSGCVAITVAAELEQARIQAVDVSSPALAVAQANANRHGLAGRVHFVCGGLLDCFRGQAFDFVLSNPPYGALSQPETFSPTVLEHEPERALFGGTSGLEIMNDLVSQTVPHLRARGYLIMEIGIGQSEAVTGMIRNAGLNLHEIVADLQGIPRCVVAQRTTTPRTR